MLVDLRNMKAIPEKVSAIERELARLKVIAGMSYAVFAAVLTGVTAALIRLL
jgi:G:T-mismatch repair DNA endonuclease (very short patch repair protein)